MNLYEIDSRLAALLDLGGEYVDENTGEVLTYREVDALQMERADKLEAWGLWIKNRTAEAAAIEAEIDNLKERLDRLNRKVANSKEAYKSYLAGEKIKTGRLSVSYRRSSSVDYTGDPESLPDGLKTVKVEVKPDKKAIRQRIEAGEEIQGARLVENVSLIIK